MNRRIAPAFIDCLFCLLLLLILVLVPPVPQGKEVTSPGTVSVEIHWPNGPVDIDLWVKAPGDSPVGYSRLSGRVFNLLRDDLGTSNDDLAINYETAYSRGAPDGEWIVNVHYYSGGGPVSVDVIASVTINGKSSRIFVRTVTVSQGEEVTVARWQMVDRRKVRGSMHYTPIKLRAEHP